MRTATRPSAFLTLLKVPSSKVAYAYSSPSSPTSPGYTSVSTASSPTSSEFENDTPPESPVRPVRPSLKRRIATLLTMPTSGAGEVEIETGLEADDEGESDSDEPDPRRKSFYLQQLDFGAFDLGHASPLATSISDRRGSGLLPPLSLDLGSLPSFDDANFSSISASTQGLAGHHCTPLAAVANLLTPSRASITTICSNDFLSPLQPPPSFSSLDDAGDLVAPIPRRIDTPVTLDPPPLKASWRKRPSLGFVPSLESVGSPLSSPSDEDDDEATEEMLDVFEPRTARRRCPKGPRIRPVGGYFKAVFDGEYPVQSIHVLTEDMSPLELPSADVFPIKAPPPDRSSTKNVPSPATLPVEPARAPAATPSAPSIRPLPPRPTSFASRVPRGAAPVKLETTSKEACAPSRPPVRRRSTHFQPTTSVATPLGLVSPSGLPRTLGRSSLPRRMSCSSGSFSPGLGALGARRATVPNASIAGLLAPVSTPLEDIGSFDLILSPPATVMVTGVARAKPWHGPKTPPKPEPEEHVLTPYAFSPQELVKKLEEVAGPEGEGHGEGEDVMERDGNPYFWGATAEV